MRNQVDCLPWRHCRDVDLVRIIGRVDRQFVTGPCHRSGQCHHDYGERTNAPAHSMTSSARARIDGGTVRPSACAVLRLTTSSNLVGCWTGRSAGFSPERMRPTYTPTWRMRPVWLAP